MYHIGAKDNIDRALVKQYASVKTSNFDSDIKINPEDMWKKINLIAIGKKTHITLMKNYKKAS